MKSMKKKCYIMMINNKNFRFQNEDEPFNYDLDIPKEDFSLLINNFKKFKFKNK